MTKPKYDKTQRSQWYLQVGKGHKTVIDVCQMFGISRKTYYKWYDKDHGFGGNNHLVWEEQRATKLTYEVKCFIEETKRKFNYGPRKMVWAVKRKFDIKVSSTIIYRYFRKKHLIRKPQRRLPWYEPLKEHIIVVKPGQAVQMDIKYVYQNARREYQFSVFDPFTEKYHFTILPTKESKNAIVALNNAEKYFGFKIESIQTDNGSEFRGLFHDWLTQNNVPHYFIPKSSPYWNAQVERVHRTVDDEYYHNPLRIWTTVYDWLEFYNFERLHETLNGITPHEKYLQSVTLDC